MAGVPGTVELSKTRSGQPIGRNGRSADVEALVRATFALHQADIWSVEASTGLRSQELR
jgi:hypothetical protein